MKKTVPYDPCGRYFVPPKDEDIGVKVPIVQEPLRRHPSGEVQCIIGAAVAVIILTVIIHFLFS